MLCNPDPHLSDFGPLSADTGCRSRKNHRAMAGKCKEP